MKEKTGLMLVWPEKWGEAWPNHGSVHVPGVDLSITWIDGSWFWTMDAGEYDGHTPWHRRGDEETDAGAVAAVKAALVEYAAYIADLAT